MKTIGKFSASTALYIIVSVFWYTQLIIGGAFLIASIWLVSAYTGAEITAILEDEGTIDMLRGHIYHSLIWFKSNARLSMLITTLGNFLGLTFGLWAIYHLRRLIKNIISNQIYEGANMNHSRKVALGIFAVLVIDAIFKMNFSWLTLSLALVALVFAEVLRQGIALEEEQKYTI